ncbi:MAG TPA: thioredoxin domain-containing protein [Candidatus Binatia bacterium]|nr:thioredoxin domain-containing protein [Candidatus Binatia bacterium]
MATNRLAKETSPYLLQHAHNPVDWYPWGEEAFARARAEDKPIFLSIGYAACHWCHVMERESFEDEATAAQLNRDFVAIKVDREERPDVDAVYMAAVQAMTGGGGWPMSVFLTPDGKPFYGGTYFPPEPRHGLPSFRQVLAGVRRAWDEQRAEVEQAGTRLVAALVERARVEAGGGLPDRGVLEAAVDALERTFDRNAGGWGGAPKFPAPMTIEFLLRRAAAGPNVDDDGIADPRAYAMARWTLDRMADGGIFDQLGGGFHRYAVDAAWRVPHFEKMLYDNAQLARVYLHAWQLTGEGRYLDVATATLEYLLRELRTAEGAFAASQDADTDGVEGGTYTWTPAEIREALAEAGLADDVRLVELAYGVTEAGNLEGRTVLARVRSEAALADALGLDVETVRTRLEAARRALLAARERRRQPARDDKVLAAWNGLAIGAFADAARSFGAVAVGGRLGRTRLDPALAADLAARADRYRAAAIDAAEVVVGRLLGADGRLRRSWKDGRTTGLGVLEDYTHLADGLLALYEATFDERWFTTALGLVEVVRARFAAPEGGFFDTADDHDTLVLRPRELQDGATPSGNAMAASVLLRLAALTGDGALRADAERAIAAVGPYLGRYPNAFGQWLLALDFALAPAVEVAVVGEPTDPAVRRLLVPALGPFRPHQVVACGPEPAASRVPLLGGRFALGGRPTAFVCRNFACRQPVTEPEALEALLAEDWGSLGPGGQAAGGGAGEPGAGEGRSEPATDGAPLSPIPEPPEAPAP